MPVYKKEQSGTWFCKFCYTDWNGARKQKKKEGFKTKKEAQDFERDFLNKAARSCEMRFSCMADLYLEDCKPRLKPTTLFNKETIIRQNRQDLILPPKTPKSRRVVTLPAFLAKMMEEYTAQMPEGRIFPVTKHFLFHEMERGSAKAGLRRIRVHDLRHSHASFLIEKGFSPLLIAERLGHENIQTTLQIYSHLYPNKQHEVAEMIQQFHEAQTE